MVLATKDAVSLIYITTAGPLCKYGMQSVIEDITRRAVIQQAA